MDGVSVGCHAGQRRGTQGAGSAGAALTQRQLESGLDGLFWEWVGFWMGCFGNGLVCRFQIFLKDVSTSSGFYDRVFFWSVQTDSQC